jgi:uncharacterized protein YyaL (SSP411 family)
MIQTLRRIHRVTIVLPIAVFFCSPGCFAQQSTPDASQPFTNHLANERSPYLLQHAHNPVDWYPWGAEAMEKARKENKPIFLSIGYSTCHWCHVMERESFENPEVAKLINDNFVAIKVDREERPDLDAVYMQFVTAITGDGGWPMTVFMTPDLKPFFGGTYFPPETRDGIPGLKSILPKVHEAWATQHDKVLSSADRLTQKLRELAGTTQAGKLNPAILDEAAEAFRTEFDVHHGGFSDAPKFPRPVVLDFLFHCHYRTGDQTALDMPLQTLRAMAAGGIHDQLGGGFHRYSTDERWFLPHFEKMLYDQAQLASRYLDAYQITHDPFFADTARDILDYVLRDLTGPEGQFFCAEDADSAIDRSHLEKKSEGAFYVWTAAELNAALGDVSAKIFAYRFGVQTDGNVEADSRGEFKGKNVLYLAHSISETAKQFSQSEQEIRQSLDAAKAKLLEVRSHRPRPSRDDKLLVAWNGLMISAYARGGAILQEPRYAQASTRAAEFIHAKLYDAATGRLTRRWRDGHAEIPGFLDDYAFYIQGLVDLYESSFDIHWLKLAIDLQHKQDELFADPKAGGYFQAAGGDASVLVRLKEDDDNACPAANSVSALNLLRLAQFSDDKDFRDRADKTLNAFASQITRAPTAMPQMLVAFDFRLSQPRQIVIAGTPDAPETLAMLKEIEGRYLPNKIVLVADGGEGQKFLGQRLPFLQTVTSLGGHATAYVCENYACQLPTTDVVKFGELFDVKRSGEAPP